MNVLDYIAHETERQSGTVREALGMRSALSILAIREYPMTETVIKRISMEITGNGEYRKVPAVFNQGMPAVNARLVPPLMFQLCVAVNDRTIFWNSRNHKADIITKEFLAIHPFADGNGRVGSLLWNWLRGSLSNPEPMPYFFGEN